MLTHAHPDHLGAAEDARRACGATVHVHRPEVPRAHGKAKGSSPFTLVPGLLPTMWRPSATAFVLHATARGFMFPTWVENVTPFDVGDILDVPGRPRPIATPGHTEGHVSFVLEDHGVAITGDAIATLNVLTRDRGPQLMPDPLNQDADRARRSLNILAALSVDTLLPGHGNPFRGDPADAVNQAREADR
jgi:glyoxylase-like metal-dependent hydrolase (beta-lactamase superfamily II)